MTQWKLVPVEPMSEMIEAAFGTINYTMPEPSEDAGRVYSAMLSAAPSPAGDEVERVARALLRDEIESYRESDVLLDEHIQWWKDGKDNPESCVHYSSIGLAMRRARAAIAAMRPAETHVSTLEAGGVMFEKYAPLGESARPTLSEEDRARVGEIRQRIMAIRDAMLNRKGPTLGDLANAEQALSLIDKLTEAG